MIKRRQIGIFSIPEHLLPAKMLANEAIARAQARGELWIMDCRGARTADIERGIDAARDVFARWNLTPAHCDRQMQALAEGDAWGERGVAAWREAESAALRACCDGWQRIPEGAHLEYRP